MYPWAGLPPGAVLRPVVSEGMYGDPHPAAISQHPRWSQYGGIGGLYQAMDGGNLGANMMGGAGRPDDSFVPPDDLVVNRKKRRKWEIEKEEREEGKPGRSQWDTKPALLRLTQPPCGPPKIYPFKLKQIGPDFTMGFIGKRREGKSFAMKWVLRELGGYFTNGVVMTSTKTNGFWETMVPRNAIFNGYNPGAMERIYAHQHRLVEWMKRHKREAKNINPYIFIIMEDVLDQDLSHAQQLRNIFYNGRHLKICLLISLQYAKGIPPGASPCTSASFVGGATCEGGGSWRTPCRSTRPPRPRSVPPAAGRGRPSWRPARGRTP